MAQGRKRGYYSQLENSNVRWGCKLPKRYEVWFLHVAFGFSLTMEGAQHRKVGVGKGKGVKMISNRRIQQALVG